MKGIGTRLDFEKKTKEIETHINIEGDWNSHKQLKKMKVIRTHIDIEKKGKGLEHIKH